jgi:hypothetical protein
MTPARWVVLAAGLPVALALIALASYGWADRTVLYLAGQSQVGYPVGFSVPVSGAQARVTDSNGDLTVRAGSGRRIVVRGYLSSSFARPSLRWGWSGDGLALNPQCFAQAGNCSLSLGVTVPAGLPVSAGDAFGLLDARGLHGRVTLSQNSGDLTASRLTGTVHLADSFGALTATGLAGSIQLDNSSGDIRAAGVIGNSRFQDSFGTISVTGLAAADVVAANTSGDISLTFTKVPHHVNVTDSFGSVTLVLPPGPATYRVQTRDSFGSTIVSVPRSPSARNVITVTNNSGDITIMNHKPPGPHAAPRPVISVRPVGPARPATPFRPGRTAGS